MSHVVIIGCGIVGATIAYELSLVKNLKITVIDRQPPAQASTGAALGVLMGVISQKIKGQAWRRRETSLQRYETLIPELEAITGRKIPFNRQGIVSLLGEEDNLARWENLAAVRQSQGWKLELWDTAKLKNYCPQIAIANITRAVYSPQDRQLNPTTLTLALAEAAQHNGVAGKFGVNVLGISPTNNSITVETTEGKIAADWVVISAGLGSTPLTAQLNQVVEIRPVLGQALQVRLEQPLGNLDFQPVVTGNDVHIVPVGGGNYWVGATVEFSSNGDEIPPSEELFQKVWHQAIAFCPDLAPAEIIRTWSGLRPRPEGRPAPVIEKLSGFTNVLLATAHYRNGVLLAPATAAAIREMIS
ncbi:FAD-dependent oxidoreductase [Nodularia harveyana UHCC-0300]|uniref:FAD-dependent oxidoreductase n=1 Tax=Nodularia harveyana UHCC-0300 TaxID=2974287 RepID=A0ABU5UAC1_9CYAN|nr:FAD-dependent oxidoreductase [Nodularia harveyana]MEA5580472.1 FAD-dependent oxidoreductase [Nodularia harveyana UHCC-0300]